MMNLEDIKVLLQHHKADLRERFGVKEIGIFGSYAKGKQRKQSDVDILVSFKKAVDFIEFIRLENYLSELLSVKVDLVTKNALKPYIGKRILEEVVYI